MYVAINSFLGRVEIVRYFLPKSRVRSARTDTSLERNTFLGQLRRLRHGKLGLIYARCLDFARASKSFSIRRSAFIPFYTRRSSIAQRFSFTDVLPIVQAPLNLTDG